MSLTFEQAYRIYSRRWQIAVFFKESKQYLRLGKNQAQDFDIQIASTTLTMIQYNILSAAKRFADYESMGALFRSAKAEILELTMADPKGCLWQKKLEVDNRNFNSISRNI